MANIYKTLIRKWGRRPKNIDDTITLPATAEYTLKCERLLGDHSIDLLYWPSYSNPYQKLFYGRAANQFNTREGTIEDALRNVRSNKQVTTCFHLHWINLLMTSAHDSECSREFLENFLGACGNFQHEGGVLIWTVHNLIDHECVDEALEKMLRKSLASMADIIIVHSDNAASAVAEAYDAPPERILSIDHGNYIGIYEDSVSRSVATEWLGFPDQDTVFLNFGYMRPYKGLDRLIEEILRIDAEGGSVGLVLAGRAREEDASSIKAMTAGRSSISITTGYIADDEVQHYFNASDFVVLPYRTILTSGSALLALSFAVPVIAPAMGGLSELVDDGVNGFLYDPGDSHGLKRALETAIATDPVTRVNMAEAAFSSASTFRWSDGRSAFLRKILKRRRLCRNGNSTSG